MRPLHETRDFEDLPFFYGHDDRYGYDDWELYMEEFFCYYQSRYNLTNEMKYKYAKIKLMGEARYWWYKKFNGYHHTWSFMKAALRHRYLPPYHRPFQAFSCASKSQLSKPTSQFQSRQYSNNSTTKEDLTDPLQRSKEMLEKLRESVRLEKLSKSELEYELKSKEIAVESEIEIEIAPHVEIEHGEIQVEMITLHPIPIEIDISHIEILLPPYSQPTKYQIFRCFIFAPPLHLPQKFIFKFIIVQHYKTRGRVFSKKGRMMRNEFEDILIFGYFCSLIYKGKILFKSPNLVMSYLVRISFDLIF